jgi:hypothetical protein
MDSHIAKYKSVDPGKQPEIKEPFIPNRNSTKIEKFEVDESNIRISQTNNNQINRNLTSNNVNSNINSLHEEDFFSKSKRLYNEFWSNPQVRHTLCPFDNESEGCQICYKICAGMTVFVLLWVLYLIFQYK